MPNPPVPTPADVAARATPPTPPSPAAPAAPAGTPAPASPETSRDADYWRTQHEAAIQAATAQAQADAARIAELEQAQLTETERQIATARDEGRAAALAEIGPQVVEATIRARAGARGVSEEQIATLLASVNVNALHAGGVVNADQVDALVDLIAPPAPTGPGPGAYVLGQGHRAPIQTTDRDLGKAEADKRFGKKD